MRFTQTQTIVLANQKGGCGKTTTAVNLSAGLAREGYRTCLVDLDGQCNASTTFGIDPEEYRRSKKPTVLDAYINKRPADQIAVLVEGRFNDLLSIVPGHPALAALHQQLEAGLRMDSLSQQLSPEEEDDHRRDHRGRLAKSLEALHTEFDCVVLDTPPELGFLLSTALRASDWFIIPVFPSEYDLNGLQRLTASAKKIRERGNPHLRLMSVLVGNYDKSTVLDDQIYTRLQKKFGEHLSKVRVSRGVKIRESTSHHTTIFEHAESSEQAKQFADFTQELVARIEKSLEAAPVEDRPGDTLTPAQPPVPPGTTDDLAVGEVSHG